MSALALTLRDLGDLDVERRLGTAEVLVVGDELQEAELQLVLTTLRTHLTCGRAAAQLVPIDGELVLRTVLGLFTLGVLGHETQLP